jgi:hypothetical protein
VFIRYIELRGLAVERPLGTQGLSTLRVQTIDLATLQATYPGRLERLEQRVGRTLGCRDWLPRFPAGATATVRPEHDPGDFAWGPTTRSGLLVTFDPAATAALSAALSPHSHPTDPAPWELESIRLWLAGGSPVLNVASVFRPYGGVQPERFGSHVTSLSCRIDTLWPVFAALLDRVREGVPGHVWPDPFGAFLMPPTFLTAGHPDFDPSAIAVLTGHLVLRGPDEDVRRWRDGAGHSARTPLGGRPPSGAVVTVAWRTVVWVVPDVAGGPDESHLTEQMTGEVSATAVSNDISLVRRFRRRLYAALLDGARGDRYRVPARELRDAVYHGFALAEGLVRRSGFLADVFREYHEENARVSGHSDAEATVRHLGNLVLSAAEGQEQEAREGVERAIQYIALGLAALALLTLALDGVNFLHGEASAEDGDKAGVGWRYAVVSIVFVLAAALTVASAVGLRDMFRRAWQGLVTAIRGWD